MAGLRIT
ncbi:hypothetical protein YPPY56_0994, partial [Yersinia pestis PY-56]